ncbi:MAG: hypothetical protein CVT72_15710 [Alphaproteobacteria bacterium HGW-Alphaproteobacteria-11]|nr:MAG: hypothetical protein CVT72_15710 [Alphaproteobacteria bacterium HGW-Alphaproteobacteria-11]
MRRIQAVLAVLTGLFLAAPAGAATSQYSSIDIDDCTMMVEDEITNAAWFVCPSFGDHTVTVVEGDLRYYIEIDDQDREKMLSGQTLAPFNRLGKMLEWRLGRDGKAFATIVRYHTQPDSGDGTFHDGQVLVVSKIGAEACHVAYVDARANADANALARAAADEHAATFNCATDTVLRIGKPDRSLGE